MKASKYTLFFPEDNHLICYNTISGSYIRISSDYVAGDDFHYERIPSEKICQLEKMHFIVQDDDNEEAFIVQQYLKTEQEYSKVLFVTIEITTNCNLSCGFCYQQSWQQRRLIPNEVVDHIIHLIRKSTITFEEINIDIIGGEPFINKEKVLYVFSSFERLCKEKRIRLSVKLNTNGFLLDEQTLSIIHDTEIMLPFLDENDYGTIVRSKNGSNTANLYSSLKDNILTWLPVLEEDHSKKVLFRYNVNHNNYKQIDSFFKTISAFGLPNFGVFIVNTGNFPGNTFINRLSEEAFFNWYISTVMPLCKKYNIRYPIQPRNAISKCKAQRLFSFKVFADGRIGLCNGLDYSEENPYLFQLSSLNEINEVFASIKSYRYVIDEKKCQSCAMVFLCGGNTPCKKNQCPFDYNSVIRHIRKKSELDKQ